jgi:PRTRC genetic system protein A
VTAALPPPLASAALVRHTLALGALAEPERGIAWIVAANGVFKRGYDGERDLLVRVQRQRIAVPGLVALLPHARFTSWAERLPASFLAALLQDARQAMSGEAIARPIEKQYFVVYRDGGPRLIAPRAQQGTPGSLRYAMPGRGALLVDIHSHHEMAAYFSQTDDRDDTGLSVSLVIGKIYTRPELCCRLNVYGHRQRVPARLLFDGLGPFRDAFGGDDDRADD